MHLQVRSEFDGHEVGTILRDRRLIDAILADHRERFVIRIADVPEMLPDAEPEKT